MTWRWREWYAEAAGLNPAEFASYSGRAGFVTNLAETGATTFKIAEVNLHKSTNVLAGCVRRADLSCVLPRGGLASA
jgi:hypothetical protein